jgi:pantoate--beta-alanine ligase
MDTVHSLDDARETCRRLAARGSLGLVPTMGALHEGHLSLVRRARAENDAVAVSIFVNPLQFGPHEDLGAYPRDEAVDCRLLAAAGADAALVLSAAEMYPEGFVTRITQSRLTTELEGAARPDHFDGVLTVVAKLLLIAGPRRAYFGRKDFQQTVVVRRMVRDLDMPVEVVVCDTCRESDGLALSSRNVYLSPAERAQGLGLVAALAAAEARFETGERSSEALETTLRETLARFLDAPPDYAAIVTAEGLERPHRAQAGDVAVLAAPVGPTRLLDNHILGTKLDLLQLEA